MNAINNLLSTEIIQTLGWTLLHSVWQGVLILSLSVLVLNFIPSRLSHLRYVVALASLTTLLIASTATFFILNSKTGTAGNIAFTFSANAVRPEVVVPVNPTFLQQIQTVLQNNMLYIVWGWIVGSLLFSLRVVGGSFYLSLIQRDSLDFKNEWPDRLKELSHQLGINSVVRLAESARIQAPLVLGYIKPIILLPAGMIAGLSTQQVEMVLVHELMHIKRHDYLVNVLQIIVESLFFFNPFVWMLSENIRKEREHCCDDAVIQHQGNAFVYAATLARLEEVRLTKVTMGVAFAENKNQLLNRIRRLMEKSVKNHSARERLIPVILVVVGLVCASWLTIGVRYQEKNKSAMRQEIKADTTKRKHEKTERSASYSRTKVTTLDEHGEPYEQITEEFEGDEALRPMMAMAAVPAFEFDIPAVPMVAEFNMPPMPSFSFSMDTIPFPANPAFAPGNWQVFQQEFEKKFKEQFGDFYKKNQHELNEMLEEIQHNMNENFNDEWAANLQAQVAAQEKMAHDQFDHVKFQEEAFAKHEEAMHKFEQDMKRWEEENAIHMRELDQKMKAMEDNMKRFEKALQEQLVKDGYLKANEKIHHMKWDDEGTIEINGKTIKDSDRKKYDELHRKYLGEGSVSRSE